MPPDPLHWIPAELDRLAATGLRRRLRTRSSPAGPTVVIDGRELVNFGSNDYLGLAGDPRVAQAVADALPRTGWGAGASPLVCGRSSLHAELERALAEFEHTEAALLFPTGFAANAGTIPTLVEHGDLLLADELNHASLIDGCRLAHATRQVYPHADTEAVAKLLATHSSARRKLLVTDSVFSMDGDFAPLLQLGELAAQHGAMLLVDEAHATGVWGATGSGAVEHFAATHPQLMQQVAVRIGTLSKGLGSLGGFVAGPQELIDWLANRARSYVFSTAPPAALCAAALAALDIARREPQRRTTVQAHASWLRQALSAAGWNLGPSDTQIVPVVLGDAERTVEFAARLEQAGYYVPGIRPPTVPPGGSLLRISVCAHHTAEQLQGLVSALASASC